jgi:hypothetical protein
MLLSCAKAPHGAIYGWDLESETKERKFEYVSKSLTYGCIQYDFRRELVVATTRSESRSEREQKRESEGCIRVVSHLGNDLLEVPPEGRGAGYTMLSLSVPQGVLFAGTEHGSIRLFKWPLVDGGAASNPFIEFSVHAHSITSLALTQDGMHLFSSCEGGAVMASAVQLADDAPQTSHQILQKYVKYRRRTDKEEDKKSKASRDDERKAADLQKKLTEAAVGMATSAASLDELVLVPKNYLNEKLHEIKELEDKMQRLRHDSEYQLEQKEQEIQDKINALKLEKKRQLDKASADYDNLFTQNKKANEQHQGAMVAANQQFDKRTQELQKELEGRLSKEYEKQSELLNELKSMRDLHQSDVRAIEAKHEEQITELRGMQEKVINEWRGQYDKVCNILKSDGLKFEEALTQQEAEYESQISEINEHKRVALQVESEKSTTALKDGVSMRQTIQILYRQLEKKDQDLLKSKQELEDTRKKLENSQAMYQKQEVKLKEREKGLQVKDESLAKLREQMKHLESFRFVLFHKVKELEEERDPLEHAVSSLKTSVRDMYGEFVREFRQKQKLDQQLADKKTLVQGVQKSNDQLYEQLSQLKKDGRRLFQDLEAVLHADNQDDFEKMPKKLKEVVDKHRKMEKWNPPVDEEGKLKTDQEQEQEYSLVRELESQKNLLFRKNQIAVGQASQTKRECMQDFRRLTHENAELIAEMNRLRNERKSMERSYKEMEAAVISLRGQGALGNLKGPGAPMGGGGPMTRSASAANVSSGASGVMGGAGGASAAARTAASRANALAGAGGADTPFIRRKQVDQEEQMRKLRQKQQNQLPPVASPGSSGPIRTLAPMKASGEEVRFAQTLGSMEAERAHLENQGFDLSRLHAEVQNFTHAAGAAIPADAGAAPGAGGGST